MDEIIKTGSAKRAPYGEEQRNAFMEWLRTTSEKAADATAKYYSEPMASYVLDDYFTNVENLLKEEQKRGRLFSLEEQEMSVNGRVIALDAFKARLSKALEDFRTSSSEFPIQPDQFPQLKEFENRLQAEINAVQAGLAAVDPTLAPDDLSVEPEAAETAAEIKQNESADDFDYTKYKLMDETEARALEEQELAPMIQKHRESIAKSARTLKNSKTLVNSKEYCDLIDMMEKVGAGKTDKIPNKNQREQFAQELYALHEQTEKYLKHKAKDGVKKNAYRKLLAVERANNALLRAAYALGDVKVSTGVPGETRNLNEVPFKLVDRLQGRTEEQYSPKPMQYYEDRAKALKKKNPSLGENVSKNHIAEYIKSVDECMSKIMLKAEEIGEPAAMNTLSAMKQSFLDDPFPVVNEQVKKIEPKVAEAKKIL